MRSFLVAAFVVLCTTCAAAQAPGLSLLPQPASVKQVACEKPLALGRALRFGSPVDPGGFELLRARWTALGIPPPVVSSDRNGRVDVEVTSSSHAVQQRSSYALSVAPGGVTVRPGASPEAGFDALMTLAQLPERHGAGWVLPCVEIADEPAMAWRIVSDDVSRGPFPTMAYAKERIRTLASLKINGWSPYMEQVVVDPRAPFIAWPSGWTLAQIRELTVYARRYHVTLIPEQQTFAHMHETLKWELAAPLAELPHGYLVAESDPRTYQYLDPLVRGVANAALWPPFVHLGSDEPLDLGRGRTPRTPQIFAAHVTRVAAMLPRNVEPMIWDDAIQQDRSILGLIPRDTIVVTYHYGAEKTFRPYIDTIANGGFSQMVGPGAANWNEIYPDLETAYANVGRFVGEGKGVRGMLGMFMTVWHDDGESLYEATWPSVAYASASAWQRQPVDDATWHRTFARAFFGTDDSRYADDLDALRAIRTLLRADDGDAPDYLFWRDPFDPRVQARAAKLDLVGIRNRAETVMQHLWSARPPLHAQAAAVMKLGALRYDQLGRRLQIGKEARDYYEDARSAATKPNLSRVYRSLFTAKYFCWELRDALANIEPLYAAAWRAENTEGGLARILVHYRASEAAAQRCADRIDTASREDYERRGTVPSWDDIMR